MDKTFLTDVQKEGEIKSTSEEHEEEKDTPSESSTENKPEEGEPASSTGEEGKKKDEPESKKDEPAVFQAFHNHPRWKALQLELGELREFREKVTPLLERIGEMPKGKEEKTEIPAWFIDLFGENADAWAKYRTYNAGERKALRDEILAEIKEESRKASEETKKWDKWVDKELSDIVEDGDIQARAKAAGFDFSNKDQSKAFRNELLKVALDYQPSDEDNNISLRKAFDILELQKLRGKSDKPGADSKKTIADKTMGKTKSDGERKDYKTPADLAGRSFRDLVPDE